MSDGFREIYNFVGSGRGDFAARVAVVSEARWAARDLRRDGKISERSLLARFNFILRIFQWGQWRGAGRKPSNGLDRAGSEADSAERRIDYKHDRGYAERRPTFLRALRSVPLRLCVHRGGWSGKNLRAFRQLRRAWRNRAARRRKPSALDSSPHRNPSFRARPAGCLRRISAETAQWRRLRRHPSWSKYRGGHSRRSAIQIPARPDRAAHWRAPYHHLQRGFSRRYRDSRRRRW